METLKQFTLTVKDKMTALYIFKALEDEARDESRPDRISLEFHDEKGAIEVGISGEGGLRRQKFKTYSLAFPVVFFPAVGGVAFVAGREVVSIEMPTDELPALLAEIEARNAKHGFRTPKQLLPDAAIRSDYVIHTGQEIDVLARSACDGRTGKIWRNESQRQALIYEPKGESHRVEITQRQTDPDQSLADLVKSQDADFVLALLYVVSVLAPPAPMPRNRYAGGWIDLADVMEKIGWYPSKVSKEKAAELRARVWSYLVYGDQAAVIGARTGSYFDKATGETLPTRVESPIWRIMALERPEKQSVPETPARVELVIGKEWEPLLTSAQLAQYLPSGELLGSIPPNKVAGDWARSVGLALAGLWRRRPREIAAGSIKPTRRELLTKYTPKTRSVEELLGGNDPRRAVGYWRDSLAILVERGFIAPTGEAALSVAQMLKPFGRESWQTDWLDAPVLIAPGPKMQAPVYDRAQALPPLKPKALQGKRRGRPRKKAPV
jgi:hypothetical protein